MPPAAHATEPRARRMSGGAGNLFRRRFAAGRIRFLAVAMAAFPSIALAQGASAGAGFDPEAGLPLIRNFTPEVYRGHSQIFATTRTADGVMFFGTYGQVVSFDGEHWRQHPITGTWTRALTVGSDGLVYVGGGAALGRLEAGESGPLRFVSLVDRLPPEQRGFPSVWSAVTAGDTVLFAIDGATLAWSQGTFRVQPFPNQRPAVRRADDTVFCHVGDQLLRWSGRDWLPFARDAAIGSARRLTVLPGDARWIVALDTGVLLSVSAEGVVTPWSTPAEPFLRRAGIRNGTRLADGAYAWSTSGEGIVLMEKDGRLRRRLGPGAGLAHTGTYGTMAGPDGLLWVETANGLSVLDPLAPWTLFDLRNGRPDTIGGDPLRFGSSLLLSMADIPPLRLVPSGDPLELARLEPFGGTSSARLSNTVPLQGGLIGGNERGLVRIDEQFRPIHATSSQVEDFISLEQLPGVLFVGMLRGFEIVRVAPDFSVTLLARVPEFEHETTNVDEFPDRTVWVGTTSGVALRLRLNPDGTVRESKRFGPAEGLPAGATWLKIHRAPGGPLFCLRDGVFTLDASGERVVPDLRFARQRPAGVNTLPITGDDAGRFWFQVPGGTAGFQVGCLDTRGGGEPAWTLLPPEISQSLGFGGARLLSYLKEAGREILWISGVRSTVRLDLSSASPLPAPPSVVITELVQGADRWPARAATRTLPFRREPLRLLFASPAAALGPVSYETRLIGYSNDWAAASATEATFTNLVGGPFTLEVRARDAHDRPGPVARTTFAVSPPWHRTPLAFTLYGLGLFSLMLGFVRWRLSRAERERQRLEGIVAERTRDLASARDQAEAASRAKSAFLAAMSHELRTPLNGVIGYAQILGADPRLVADQRARLRIVHQSGEHLLRMINDVLDLAKIEAGKLELRPAPLALRDLIHDVSAAHAPAAAAKGLAFGTEVSADLPPWIEADAHKLRQVLDNLLGNAIKFTAHGSVRLTVEPRRCGETMATSAGVARAATEIEFAVTDTGPGISAADQQRLFQPFEQAQSARPAAPGTGLGLAISRAIVERMGGTLAFASTPGAGSRFACAVPLAPCAAPIAAGTRAAVVGYDGPRKHVLIVDDHAVNRSLLSDLLTPLGFTCREASSGQDALEHLASAGESWPDLAIVDLRMEGMDGLELTRRLRAQPRGAGLRVLLTSASVIGFDQDLGRAAGCDAFLPKPFRIDDLVSVLGRLLALKWREAAPVSPADASALPTATALPADVAARLRELLAIGDLEAFGAAVRDARARHPESEPHWRALEEAAGGYQLSRLRQLLDAGG